MQNAAYRVWDRSGGAVAVGEGMFGAHHIGIAGVAKPAEEKHPLQVVNELIGGDLGRAIRLPIPPGFVIMKDKKPHHVSLNFSLTGEKPPPAAPTAIAADHPEEACGVILFDLWIANNDRHEKNLAYEKSTKRLNLFDHGLALMCTKDGRSRLEGVDADVNRGLLTEHCLTPELVSGDGFAVWFDRINQMPEWCLREAVLDTKSLGLEKDLADFCVEFLLKRRLELMDIIKANSDLFTGIQPTFWNSLNVGEV
jgi:hypothetical protein